MLLVFLYLKKMTSKGILVARLYGGLGNQLFIYAAARAISLRSNAPLVLDIYSGFIRDKEFKRQYKLDYFIYPASLDKLQSNKNNLSRFNRLALRGINNFLPLKFKNYIQQYSDKFNPKLVSLKIKKATFLDGYWQDERYFDDFSDVIAKDLEYNFALSSKSSRLLTKIKNTNSAAIHIRFFDEDIESNLNLKLSYYKNFINYIESNFPQPTYFIFSDNYKLAQDMFLRLSVYLPNLHFVNNISDNSELEDFVLISSCKYIAMANSTFSWWASWIGEKKNKAIIFYPARVHFQKSNWDFSKLTLNRWIEIGI
jgi:hypothetical protein